jgi:cytoskeletal protein RodZ
MMMRASGHLALILATGIFVWFAGQPQATAAGADTAAKSESATAGKSIKQGSRDGKRSAQDKSEKAASKSSDSKKAADAADAAGNMPSVLPAAIANSNGELTSANAGAGSNKAGTTLAATDKPAEAPAAEPDVIASDQLNDVDREMQGRTPPSQPQQQTIAMAPAKAAPVLASSDSSALDQTSLIGKVFIAFGALLTMASAARMLMA